jgi:hypothetical protein
MEQDYVTRPCGGQIGFEDRSEESNIHTICHNRLESLHGYFFALPLLNDNTPVKVHQHHAVRNSAVLAKVCMGNFGLG